MSVVFPGRFSLCDFSRARSEVLSRLSDQHPRPCPGLYQSHSCCGCGAPMVHHPLHTADAGQAYEVIGNTEINKIIDELFTRLSKLIGSKDPPLASCTAPRLRPPLGGALMICCVTELIFSLAKSAPAWKDCSG